MNKSPRYTMLCLCGALCAAVLAAGCSNGQGRSGQLEEKVNALQQQVERREFKDTENMIAVRGQLNRIANSMVGLETYARRNDAIRINPEDKGFQRVDTGIGYFLIACENIQPSGDGYKLTLVIGNPGYVSYNGFALHLTWGRDFGGGTSAEFQDWKKGLRQRTEDFPSVVLRPGTWNRAEVSIAPASQDEKKFIQLKMTTSEVTFQNKAEDSPEE